MTGRLIINDLRRNKLANASICIFMAISAMLFALSVFLLSLLGNSIDRLMAAAETPDFLQMHEGSIEESKFKDFVKGRDDIEEMQILGFLNVRNSDLTIGSTSFADNMQDNGLSCQSGEFDFLLDEENRIIAPGKGEVYVPVCYRLEYGINRGDLMRIGPEQLKVAGFLRDSQMNSMMASSKRFLVSRDDYERLKPLGSEEYLIEFRLRKGKDINAFAAAYEEASLPDNGPKITFPLIKMMNALSDGIMIFVILLISFVILFISILCIRYIVLTNLEKEKPEIGMLKATGISGKDIRRLYFSKYLALSLAGCLAGITLTILISRPLGAQIRELYGDPGNGAFVFLMMLTGAFTAEILILLSVRRTLKAMGKLSALEAVRGQGDFGKKGRHWITIGIVTAGAVFMMILPRNIERTISDPGFASYMGIGESQIRIDIRETGKSGEAARELEEITGKDERVKKRALMNTSSYKAFLPDGYTFNLMIENGDHKSFPVKYSEGRAPEGDKEIALSILNAKELGIKTGDEIGILRETGKGTETVTCRVTGIYSDITNGGKTAKADFGEGAGESPVIWSVIYLSLKDGEIAESWINEYSERYAASEAGVRITEISEYLNGIYGQTIRNIKKASFGAALLSVITLFIVTFLVLRLVIWRERQDCSLKKALGFRTKEIQAEYYRKVFNCLLTGMTAGIFTGIVPGQWLAGGLLSLMGAYGLKFTVDKGTAFLVIPALSALTCFYAAFLALREIKRVRAYECLRGKDCFLRSEW